MPALSTQSTRRSRPGAARPLPRLSSPDFAHLLDPPPPQVRGRGGPLPRRWRLPTWADLLRHHDRFSHPDASGDRRRGAGHPATRRRRTPRGERADRDHGRSGSGGGGGSGGHSADGRRGEGAARRRLASGKLPLHRRREPRRQRYLLVQRLFELALERDAVGEQRVVRLWRQVAQRSCQLLEPNRRLLLLRRRDRLCSLGGLGLSCNATARYLV